LTAGLWDELGITPCGDPKAIRRAYAARLKKLDPDRNPEAFARLRRALEWALDGVGGDEGPQSSRRPQSTNRDAEPAARPEPEPDRIEPATKHSSAPPTENTQKPQLQPSSPTPDHDDIRDQALLIALDAALRRRDATEATALYYRAAATGALSLASAPDVIERLLAVAVDDTTLGAAAIRHLVRTAGLDAPRSRAGVASKLRQRVLARLGAEDWYENLLATAQQRKGRIARRRAKIARLILGRIGRHWHPRVDKTALRSWLAQYKTHEAWLGDRIDPAWVSTLEERLRRREIFWLVIYGLFIGGMLIQTGLLFGIGLIEGSVEFWAFMIGVPLVAFFLWIFTLLVKELLKLLIPGWTGFAGRGGAIWNRLKAKKSGDAG
jgi:hypothetical protein